MRWIKEEDFAHLRKVFRLKLGIFFCPLTEFFLSPCLSSLKSPSGCGSTTPSGCLMISLLPNLVFNLDGRIVLRQTAMRITKKAYQTRQYTSRIQKVSEKTERRDPQKQTGLRIRFKPMLWRI